MLIVFVMLALVGMAGVVSSILIDRSERRQVEEAELEARLIRLKNAGMSISMDASCDGDLGLPSEQKGKLSLCHDAGGELTLMEQPAFPSTLARAKATDNPKEEEEQRMIGQQLQGGQQVDRGHDG